MTEQGMKWMQRFRRAWAKLNGDDPNVTWGPWEQGPDGRWSRAYTVTFTREELQSGKPVTHTISWGGPPGGRLLWLIWLLVTLALSATVLALYFIGGV